MKYGAVGAGALVTALLLMAAWPAPEGQGFVGSAKVKNLSIDLTRTRLAVGTYRERYQALPGDDPQAAARWPGTRSGNGDGRIQGEFNTGEATAESTLFWRHLMLGGFIKDDKIATRNAENGLVGVQMPPAVGNPDKHPSDLMICSADLSAGLAGELDKALDDGQPGTGSVRAYLQSGKVVAAPPNPTRSPPLAAYSQVGKGTLLTVCQLR